MKNPRLTGGFVWLRGDWVSLRAWRLHLRSNPWSSGDAQAMPTPAAHRRGFSAPGLPPGNPATLLGVPTSGLLDAAVHEVTVPALSTPCRAVRPPTKAIPSGDVQQDKPRRPATRSPVEASAFRFTQQAGSPPDSMLWPALESLGACSSCNVRVGVRQARCAEPTRLRPAP